jgi:diacylglycerol kinase family enzyme
MKRIAVVLNFSAEDSEKMDAFQTVRDILKAAGLELDIGHVPGDQVEVALRAFVGKQPDAVIAGGGDGTVSAAADALAGTGIPLGVLPLGTLNHFAKDAGIPLMPEDAARLIARPSFQTIDLAEVNGRHFINNSSIGLYPRMVRIREEQRIRLGRGKWPAMLSAFIHVFRRPTCIALQVRANGESAEREVPFVFIGNNIYRFDLFTLGGREALDAGVLSLYTAKRCGRFSLLRLATRAVLNRLDQGRDFEARAVPDVVIDIPRPRIRAACDGEIMTLAPPLRYRIHPGALKIIAPEKR